MTVPFIGDATLSLGSGAEAVTKGLGLVGVAYLLGIPFDRFADSFLSGVEKRRRVAFSSENGFAERQDRFPEAHLKVLVLNKGGNAAEWMGYLRSRIRLSRALTVFSPALALAGVLMYWPREHVRAKIVLFVGVWLIYMVSFFLVQSSAEGIPRTDRVKDYERQKAKYHWKRDPAVAALCCLSLVGLVTGIFLAARSVGAVVIGILGPLVMILSGWTWWRVTGTFMRFLRDSYKVHLGVEPD